MSKSWLLLLAAGILEIGWAIGLKYTYGFTRLVPTVLTIACMVASMTMLAIALKHIPVGTGYAVWTGIGTVGAAILGIVLFGESASMFRVGSIALILVGIAGLKLST